MPCAGRPETVVEFELVPSVQNHAFELDTGLHVRHFVRRVVPCEATHVVPCEAKHVVLGPEPKHNPAGWAGRVVWRDEVLEGLPVGNSRTDGRRRKIQESSLLTSILGTLAKQFCANAL